MAGGGGGGRSPAQVGETEPGSWGGSVGGERHCSDHSGVRGDREAVWSEGALGRGGGRLERRGQVGCEEGILLGRGESPRGECGCGWSGPAAGPGDSGDGLVGRQCLVEREQQGTGFAPSPVWLLQVKEANTAPCPECTGACGLPATDRGFESLCLVTRYFGVGIIRKVQDGRKLRWKQLEYKEVWAERPVLWPLDSTEFPFFHVLQGQRVAELILHHARASECRDVERFKAEMAALVTQARKNTITLEKVSRPLEGQRPWGIYCPCPWMEQRLKGDLFTGRSLE